MDILRFGWRLLRVPARVRKLRRVLRAALDDPYYGPLLYAAGFGSRGALTGARQTEQALRRLPFSPLDALPAIPCRVPQVIEHPLRPGMLAVRPAPGKARYTALAGTAAMLLDAARAHPGERVEAEHALLVLRQLGEEPLSELASDKLWDAFQVPVYSLLVGFDGAVLAYECEAGCGLHATGDAIFEEFEGKIYFTSLTDFAHPCLRLETGISGKLETGLCECGRPELRVAPLIERRIFADAAD